MNTNHKLDVWMPSWRAVAGTSLRQLMERARDGLYVLSETVAFTRPGLDMRGSAWIRLGTATVTVEWDETELLAHEAKAAESARADKERRIAEARALLASLEEGAP